MNDAQQATSAEEDAEHLIHEFRHLGKSIMGCSSSTCHDSSTLVKVEPWSRTAFLAFFLSFHQMKW
jgi:hypothetical protein